MACCHKRWYSHPRDCAFLIVIRKDNVLKFEVVHIFNQSVDIFYTLYRL